MLDQVIAELRTTRDDARSQTIADWAATKDRTRLKLLSAVYRSVDDTLLNRLAAAADTYALNDPRVPTEAVSADYENLTLAVNTYAHGDRVRALDYLNNALTHNPDWRQNPIIADFAALLMRISPEQAVQRLGAPGSAGDFSVAKGANWWIEQAMIEQNVNRRTVTRRVCLFAVVAALAVGALFWTLTQVFMPLSAREFVTSVGAFDPELANAFRQLSAYARQVLVIVPIVVGLFLSVELLLRGILLHLAAAIIADARGAYLYLLHKMIPFATVFVVWVSLTICALLLLSADTLRGANTQAIEREIIALYLRLEGLAIGSTATYFVLMTRILMETYRLRVTSAALTLVVGSVIAGLLSYGASLVILSLVSPDLALLVRNIVGLEFLLFLVRALAETPPF